MEIEKWDQTDSPEILDRNPRPPFGGRYNRGTLQKNTTSEKNRRRWILECYTNLIQVTRSWTIPQVDTDVTPPCDVITTGTSVYKCTHTGVGSFHYAVDWHRLLTRRHAYTHQRWLLALHCRLTPYT